ncbi:hypothetical protein M569_07797, partial [Genlisea aurea]
DKNRLKLKCMRRGCKWMVNVVKWGNDDAWHITTSELNHKRCQKSKFNKHIKSSWLAEEYLKKFRVNPRLKAAEFKKKVEQSIGLCIPMKTAYRARTKALAMLSGTDDEQYKDLWRYCEQLKLNNPGSTIVLKLQDDGPVDKRFLRFYCCFAACKEGFKVGCRPLFGVDGCFLKGKYEGQILAAVGMDANNNIYPIAYAVVERENQETWEWFLNLVKHD